jgi:hypothetical protein
VARAERAEQNRNLILATQLGRKIAARAEHAEQNRSWESDSRKIATQIPAKDNHSDQSGSNGGVWGAGINGRGRRAWEGHGLTIACGGGHRLGLLGTREGAGSVG